MGITPDYQRRATDKYLSKMARIVLVITPLEKESVQQAAERAGQSMTGYIMQAVLDRVERERNTKIFNNTVQDSIVQDTAPQPTEQRHPRNSLPQPPDSIPKGSKNTLTFWMLDHGYTEADIKDYFEQHPTE